MNKPNTEPPPTKFTGIRLVHGTDNSHLIDKVRIGDRFWPITSTNALSLLLFKVRNVAYDTSNDYFYESPDAYYRINNSPPNPRDFVDSDNSPDTEAFDEAMEAYMTDKQEFLNTHSTWYVRKSQFIRNPPLFIEDLRMKRRGSTRGYYNSNGWPVRDDTRNMWTIYA